jgi:hypothetical protein
MHSSHKATFTASPSRTTAQPDVAAASLETLR